ncbi:MAG: 2-oxo acid dehydrogenase subunit E2 [Candidatus Hydrogenedentes bacterium]|nr:2-oxo acid dehydrogenase subunit E2 [Candidatus Hydrogenedentota bacterium]
MATEFKLPELGEGVTSGTVASVLASVGESVSANSPIIEIETDKAVAEIPLPFSGTIKEIKVKPGDKVSVGQVILIADRTEGAAAKAPAAEKKEAPKAESKPAPKEESKPAPAARKAAPAATPAAKRSSGKVLASPSVRKLARELGVQLDDVPTSDPSGRVSAQDVEAYAAGGAPSAEAPAAKSEPGDASRAPVPVRTGPPALSGARSDDRWGAVVREAMSGIRKKTAEHMEHCWTTIPHVTHFEKADITALEQVRQQYAPAIKAEGGSLTVTVFLMKVITEALRRFPKFNASLDFESEEVVLKQYYHIGIAVDTPAGLLVPAVRDVDRKSLQELALELPVLAKKARDRKLTLEDMSGTTFTISNLGGIGGTGFTPIINAPEVAILGVSRSSIEGVFQNGQLVPRTMLPLSLSYDHRLIDGADAARFMRWVAEALENPWKLILES